MVFKKYREHCRTYEKINKSKIQEYHKSYNKLNRAKINERFQQWKLKNFTYYKQWRESNKEKIAMYCKRYDQTPNAKTGKVVREQKRRAQKKDVGGSFTADQVLELFKKQKGICIYCKTKLYKSGKNKYHCDHIMPISKGGSNDISNIQLLCPSCNISKGAKLPEEFAQTVGMLI